MNRNLQALSDKIDALSQGLGAAQELLKNLASSGSDPRQTLIDQISRALPKLKIEQLRSLEDYVAFLASTVDDSGPGGGENQASTNEGDP